MENKNYIWRPVSEYTGGRVLATNGLDVIIGEINSEGDCKSEEDGSTILYGITRFIKIEEMLPELKESEEERTRKAIIKHFEKERKESRKVNYYGVDVFDILAWLEKQGEHKKFRDSIQVGDKVTRNQDGMLVNLSQLNRVAKKDEKQGEQKPADKSDSVLNILNKDNQQVQQEDLIMKPSLITVEENEMILDDVISILDNGFMPSSWERARLANGLQSLKERVQPKQEWSEEEEKLINRIEGWLDTLCDYLKDSSPECIEDVKDIVEQLKSSRLQNRWKPSDEQMNALKHVSNDCSIAFADMKILATLYEQLKALHHYEQDT